MDPENTTPITPNDPVPPPTQPTPAPAQQTLPPPPSTPPPYSQYSMPPRPAGPNGDDKIWCIVSHLSALLGIGFGFFLVPLIVYLAKRDESEFVACNSREALNFHISLLIYTVISIPLAFILIGIPLLIAIAICGLIFSIIAAIKASEGQCYRYPLTIRLVT